MRKLKFRDRRKHRSGVDKFTSSITNPHHDGHFCTANKHSFQPSIGVYAPRFRKGLPRLFSERRFIKQKHPGGKQQVFFVCISLKNPQRSKYHFSLTPMMNGHWSRLYRICAAEVLCGRWRAMPRSFRYATTVLFIILELGVCWGLLPPCSALRKRHRDCVARAIIRRWRKYQTRHPTHEWDFQLRSPIWCVFLRSKASYSYHGYSAHLLMFFGRYSVRVSTGLEL